MDALKIALETVFVGALAIFWLALAIQLFLPAAKSWLEKRWTRASPGGEKETPSSGEDQIRVAVAGVLLTALAYLVGAGVGRLAEDFFNDDDLRIAGVQISVTEDNIRESVYHNPVESRLVDPEALSLAPCELPCDRSDRIREIFDLQESTLLLAGSDKTDRLRLQHQQIVVLRGAAFDGFLTCILCLLGYVTQQERNIWRYVLPGIITLWALNMLFYHLHLSLSDIHLKALSHPLQLFTSLRADEPPLAKLTFLILGLGGFCLLVWKGNPGSWHYGKGFWAAVLATGLAYAGWYLTEIQYDRLVIYMFYAQSNLLKLH